MAFATIKLKSKQGVIKEAPVGFSWTTLFFGAFVALFRGDWMWALMMFVAQFITFGLASILFGFIYNRFYIEGLFKQGYAVISYWGDKREIERSAQINLGNSLSENISSKATPSRSRSNRTSKTLHDEKDLTDELEEIQNLYEDGTLSEAQFKKAKNKLLK